MTESVGLSVGFAKIFAWTSGGRQCCADDIVLYGGIPGGRDFQLVFLAGSPEGHWFESHLGWDFELSTTLKATVAQPRPALETLVTRGSVGVIA